MAPRMVLVVVGMMVITRATMMVGTRVIGKAMMKVLVLVIWVVEEKKRVLNTLAVIAEPVLEQMAPQFALIVE